MRPKRGLIGIILYTEPALCSDRVHALRKAYEGANLAAPILLTPRIILRLCTCSHSESNDGNSYHE